MWLHLPKNWKFASFYDNQPLRVTSQWASTIVGLFAVCLWLREICIICKLKNGNNYYQRNTFKILVFLLQKINLVFQIKSHFCIYKVSIGTGTVLCAMRNTKINQVSPCLQGPWNENGWPLGISTLWGYHFLAHAMPIWMKLTFKFFESKKPK